MVTLFSEYVTFFMYVQFVCYLYLITSLLLSSYSHLPHALTHLTHAVLNDIFYTSVATNVKLCRCRHTDRMVSGTCLVGD